MEIKVPADHYPLVSIPGGPKCDNCRFVDRENHSCRSPDYQAAGFTTEDGWTKPKGSSDLQPGKSVGDLCSDWWERAGADAAKGRLVRAIRKGR